MANHTGVGSNWYEMSGRKEPSAGEVIVDDINDGADASYVVKEQYRGTQADRVDMFALGKRQVLRRNFHLIPILGFACTACTSWEISGPFLTFALITGGPATVFWGLTIGAIGYAFVYASLAEVASMSPSSGGQYHWVSELAPPRYQKVLSYAVGWTIALGWQTYLAGSTFLAGTLMQVRLLQHSRQRH